MRSRRHRAEIKESENVIARIINCNQRIESIVSPTSSLPTSTSLSTSPHSKPRLPKLSLPKFKGDVKHWTPFWDLFQSAVHNNDKIPKDSLLEGTAYKTVQRLTLTDSNYDAANSMLKEHFGNLQQIISAHM